MDLLRNLVLILFVSTSAIILFFILIQSGKGGSIGIFGGASSNTAFGTSSVDIITKITWWCIAAFFFLAIVAAVLYAKGVPNAPESSQDTLLPEVFGTDPPKENVPPSILPGK